ncbi:MAG: hypothetical protein M3R43_11055, partial [Acidobacteriota bacterium]|nr:hypothetical protein [Acidobacteriota bacterium]
VQERTVPLAGQFDELIDSTCEHAEHEVRHYFRRAAHTDRAESELVFEPAENTLYHGSFGEAVLLGPGEFRRAHLLRDDPLPRA